MNVTGMYRYASRTKNLAVFIFHVFSLKNKNAKMCGIAARFPRAAVNKGCFVLITVKLFRTYGHSSCSFNHFFEQISSEQIPADANTQITFSFLRY